MRWCGVGAYRTMRTKVSTATWSNVSSRVSRSYVDSCGGGDETSEVKKKTKFVRSKTNKKKNYSQFLLTLKHLSEEGAVLADIRATDRINAIFVFQQNGVSTHFHNCLKNEHVASFISKMAQFGLKPVPPSSETDRTLRGSFQASGFAVKELMRVDDPLRMYEFRRVSRVLLKLAAATTDVLPIGQMSADELQYLFDHTGMDEDDGETLAAEILYYTSPSNIDNVMHHVRESGRERKEKQRYLPLLV